MFKVMTNVDGLNIDLSKESAKKTLKFVLTGKDWKNVEDTLKLSMKMLKVAEENLDDDELKNGKKLYKYHKKALKKLEYDPNNDEPQFIELSFRDVSIIGSALQAVKDYLEENPIEYMFLRLPDYENYELPEESTIGTLGMQAFLGGLLSNEV